MISFWDLFPLGASCPSSTAVVNEQCGAGHVQICDLSGAVASRTHPIIPRLYSRDVLAAVWSSVVFRSLVGGVGTEVRVPCREDVGVRGLLCGVAAVFPSDSAYFGGPGFDASPMHTPVPKGVSGGGGAGGVGGGGGGGGSLPSGAASAEVSLCSLFSCL